MIVIHLHFTPLILRKFSAIWLADSNRLSASVEDNCVVVGIQAFLFIKHLIVTQSAKFVICQVLLQDSLISNISVAS